MQDREKFRSQGFETHNTGKFLGDADLARIVTLGLIAEEEINPGTLVSLIETLRTDGLQIAQTLLVQAVNGVYRSSDVIATADGFQTNLIKYLGTFLSLPAEARNDFIETLRVKDLAPYF